jgi:hypothetical protein
MARLWYRVAECDAASCSVARVVSFNEMCNGASRKFFLADLFIVTEKSLFHSKQHFLNQKGKSVSRLHFKTHILFPEYTLSLLNCVYFVWYLLFTEIEVINSL